MDFRSLFRAHVPGTEVVKAAEGVARDHAGAEHRHVAEQFFRREAFPQDAQRDTDKNGPSGERSP
jgi:hypothetical protein